MPLDTALAKRLVMNQRTKGARVALRRKSTAREPAVKLEVYSSHINGTWASYRDRAQPRPFDSSRLTRREVARRG